MIGHNRGYAERLDSWISAPHSQCRQASAALKDLVQALQPGELHERAVRCPLPVGLQERAHCWKQHLQQADKLWKGASTAHIIRSEVAAWATDEKQLH